MKRSMPGHICLIILFAFAALFSTTALCQQLHNPALPGVPANRLSNDETLQRLRLADQQTSPRRLTQRERGSHIENNNHKPIGPNLLLQKSVQPQFSIDQTAQQARLNDVCEKISGRNFVYQDSITIWTGTASIAADGFIIIPGEYERYYDTGSDIGGVCLKTDWEGNVIWAKLYDSISSQNYHFLNFFHSQALQDGRILLAGRSNNNATHQDDFVLTLLSSDGDIIWTRTYDHSSWQGFNGSGDYFRMLSMDEDLSTGSVFFSGETWSTGHTISRIALADGSLQWSRTYSLPQSGTAFGCVVENDRLTLFTGGYIYATTYIHSVGIDKINGDLLGVRSLTQTSTPQSPQLLRGARAIRLNNGNYRLAGYTSQGFEIPYTGTKELFHVLFIDLDDQFNFVQSFGFKSKINSWPNTTEILLYPDGQGLYAQQPDITGSPTARNIVLFRDSLIYHERKRSFPNQFFASQPTYLRMPNGGFFMTTHLVDDGAFINDGSKLDYYRMHPSDTLSDCLGQIDSSISVWQYQFSSYAGPTATVHNEGFRPSVQQTIAGVNARLYPGPACQVISNCDTLGLRIDEAIICPGNDAILTITKNPACGSLVPLQWAPGITSAPVRLTDSTYSFQFNTPGQGYIKASLLGCQFFEDSLLVTVLPERNHLDLGPNLELCEGNSIQLNAGEGFASYVWQDGSTDSTMLVTAPGTYYLTALSGCGNQFVDTVIVMAHPPIALDLGPDRTKCNNDTLVLQAPASFISYEWTAPGNVQIGISSEIVVQPANDIVYYLQAEKKPGCFAYDSIRIAVLSSPAISLGSDTSLCTGDSLVLNAGTDFINYLWNNAETNSVIKVKDPGSYSVLATAANGCQSTDTLTIRSLFLLPEVSLPPASALCEGESIRFNAGSSFSSYLWSNGSSDPSILVAAPGNYSVEVMDYNGCRGSGFTTITEINPTPRNFLPADTSICSYGFIDIKPAGSFNSYSWNNASANSSLRITQAGQYWLTVVDENNCLGTDSILVKPKECMTGFFIPKAFTPNGDGLNDDFKPLLFGNIQKYQFTVYNRWGQIVFQSKTAGQGWDGRFQGKAESGNVFIWYCRYQLEGGDETLEKGAVTLIR